MSAVATGQASVRKRTAIATLFPGYFALVMATGIVSLAAHFMALEPVAQALLWVNVAAYVTLWALTLARIALYRAQFVADLTAHGRSVLFLTMVAGTCVLGSQFAILTPWMPVAALGSRVTLLSGALPSVVMFWLSSLVTHDRNILAREHPANSRARHVPMPCGT